MLIEHLESDMESNSDFYYTFKTDEDDKLVRVFWADCEARNDYYFFRDAVVFDTTYLTNKYGMIFAPFVGVNHHGQTTLFGCGLLSG